MLSEIFTQSLTKDYAESETRKNVTISSIGYCQKKLYEQIRRQEKTELSPETISKFFRGSSIHEKIPKILWKWRGKFDNFKFIKSEGEVKIKIDGIKDLVGHYDLHCEIDNKQYVVDYKIVDYMNRIKEAQQHYKDQLMMYADGLGISKCILIYFDSSNFSSKEFVFDVNQNRVNTLKMKYIHIHECLQGKQQMQKPFKEFKDGGWECKYCQYKNECWSKEEIKEGFEKNNEVKEFDEKLSIRYINVMKQKEKIDNEFDEIKEQIEKELAGYQGENKYMYANYTAPTTTTGYNKKKLESIVPLDLLSKCQYESQRKGFYKLKIKE